MKLNIKTFGFLFTLVTATVISPKQASAQQDNVSLQVFYDELSPYGEWIDYQQYGYVWIPNAGSDFIPYSTQGQWIYTDYGWTWVSNYEWGWAPFHYGRWNYDNFYGWLWVPDYEWGPAWVTWVQSDGYYGWQPMQPGISINLSFGRDYRTNSDHWTFVRDRDFERSDIQRYYINRTENSRIIRKSSVINNTFDDRSRNSTYISGPTQSDVQRVTGNKVRSVSIQENNKPGQDFNNDRLRIYRPQIRRNNETGQKPAPNKITNIDDVKRTSGKDAINQQKNAPPTNNNRPEQQQNINIPSNKRLEQQQQQNNIDQQNINKNKAQPVQRQNTNQQVIQKQDRQPENVTPAKVDRSIAQPAQQRKVSTPNTRIREQRQIIRQEKSNRKNQEKETKSQENKK